jgi:hypothetical protein
MPKMPKMKVFLKPPIENSIFSYRGFKNAFIFGIFGISIICHNYLDLLFLLLLLLLFIIIIIILLSIYTF